MNNLDLVIFEAYNANVNTSFSFDLDNVSFIPEPSTMLLAFGAGWLALVARRRRREIAS